MNPGYFLGARGIAKHQRKLGEPEEHRMSDLFYIQNSLACVGNETLWWRPDGAGYTTHLSDAGKFASAEAASIHASRATDVPWPCAEIDAIAYRAVDVGDLRQQLRSRQGHPDPSPSDTTPEGQKDG